MIRTQGQQTVIDERRCELGEGRYGEYGVIGAEQADESHYDDRFNLSKDDFADGKIHFVTDKLYGREEELAQCQELFQAYEASAVFVSGYSGSGKSRLVEEFVAQNSTITKGKPSIIFLRSKSKAMRAGVPFSSISGIFDNIDKSVSCEFVDMKDEIQKSLGHDARLLLKVFPNLEKYLAENVVPADMDSSQRSSGSLKSSSLFSTNSGVMSSAKKQDTKRRMMLALQVFFRTLSSRSKRRLCIFLDDLQWVDSLSLELIESLLTDGRINNLIFFGGYRSNEVGEGHSLLEKLQTIKQQRQNREIKGYLCIELKDLKLEAVGRFIADTLRLTFEEALPLASAIFAKTLGNPFYTRQALDYLVLKNALYYDTISFRWDWKLEETELKDVLCDDLLEMIKVKIKGLEPMLQEVLMTASCTRSTFDVETILILLHERFGAKAGNKEEYNYEKKRLITLLNQAVAEGLLVHPQDVKRNANLQYSFRDLESSIPAEDEYAFAHDKIQETARSLIGSVGCEIEFLELVGNTLSKRAQDPLCGEDWMYFTACEHLNRVSMYYKTQEHEMQEEKRPESFSDNEKELELAVLNLRTAELSIDLFAFSAALDFCDQGISHLPCDGDKRWSKKYRETTLLLYSIAAQASYGASNIEEAERYCNLVITQHSGSKSRVTTLEAIPVFLIYLDIVGSRDSQAGLEMCLEILKEFGITVPTNERKLRAKVWLSLKQIKRRHLPSEESIRHMPQVSDPTVADQMELMKKAASLAFSSDQTLLYMLLNCESVKAISEHGLTESSATSIASFANVLMHIYHDFETSTKLADLAILITDRQQRKFSETQPLNTANHNVLGWVRPIPSCLKHHERAYRSGLESGNLNGAALGKWFGLQAKLFSSQIKLRELEREFRDGVLEMRQNGQLFIACMAAVVWQMTLNFIGKSGNPNTTSLKDGEAIDQDTKEKQIKLPHLFGPWESMAFLFFGDYEAGAEDALRRRDEFSKMVPGMMYGFETVMRAIPLIIMARCDHSQQTACQKWAVKLLKLVRKWVKCGCINLEGPLQLMEAEYAALQKKKNLARSYFAMAITSCRQHQFHHFSGLSCELYSAYLSELGDSNGEIIYLQGAIDDYRRWGFKKKVDMLKAKLDDCCTRSYRE